MTIKRILGIAALSLLMAACSTNRTLQRSPATVEIPAGNERAPLMLYPESHDGTVPQTARRKPPVAKTDPTPGDKPGPLKKELPAEPLTVVRPRITFSETQSANVRVPGINPLPASGVLNVPLAQLRDEFCYPYKGKVISPYGKRGRSVHTGMDIKAVPNDTTRAVLPGVVRMSKYYSGYGNIVVIQHYCGFETVYAHHSKNLVRVNDVVEAGDPVGLAGRTGRATTEHLHFELRAAGQPLNPTHLLDPDNFSLRNDVLSIRSSGSGVLASNSGKDTDLNEDLGTDESTESESGGTLLAADAPVEQASVKPAVPVRSVPTADKPTYHKVQRGDTLSAIARRYGTTVTALCKLNNIAKDGILSLGQKVRLR